MIFALFYLRGKSSAIISSIKNLADPIFSLPSVNDKKHSIFATLPEANLILYSSCPPRMILSFIRFSFSFCL